MSSDIIDQQLRAKSEKIAKQIAIRLTEQKKLENRLHEFENSLTLLEARVDVYREERDKLNDTLAAMKEQKLEYYQRRDALITKKRNIQKSLYDSVGDQPELKLQLDQYSEQIGAVIEQSKEHTSQMDEIYNQAQEKHKLMISTQDTLREKRLDADRTILRYKRKISELEIELTKLRRKMYMISEKLAKS